MLSQGLELTLGSLNSLLISQDQQTCWTDDLPVCHLSGVGTSTNQIYRENGFRREGHEFEDRSFQFRLDNDIHLYGVFDGHGGSKVSTFAAQKMPAELLLGQLANKTTDEEIKDVLRQACIAVENGYFESLDDLLAEKYNLSQQVPENMTMENVQLSQPDLYKRLKEIETELAGGTAGLIALIINNRLYIANIGCCRALLCRRDTVGQLRVTQLTADHNLENATELQRLATLGVDTDKMCQSRKMAGRFYTRSIGDYYIKQQYQKIDLLSSATTTPLIAEPEVFGGFDIDDTCCFLALMSDGLYRTVYDAVGDHSKVNSEIAGIIADQFSTQSSYRDVAQAAVDQVVRQHYRAFECSPSGSGSRSRAHDDITLIVRGFNFPLAEPAGTDFGLASRRAGSFRLPSSTAPLSITIPPPNSSADSPPRPFFGGVIPVSAGVGSFADIIANSSIVNSDDRSPSPPTTSSYDEGDTTQSCEEAARALVSMNLDEDGRIAPYVSFAEFEAALAAMTDEERAALDAELEVRPDFEPIPEERETPVASGSSQPSLVQA